MLSLNLLLYFSLKSVKVDGKAKKVSYDECKLDRSEYDDHDVQSKFIIIKIGLVVIELEEALNFFLVITTTITIFLTKWVTDSITHLAYCI